MTRADRLAIALVVLLTALATATGVHTGYRETDVDEVVYRDTLIAMHHGVGYYDAMRAALVVKDGAPPSQVRSVRPPTLFLLLAPLPSAAWRWVVGFVYLATLVLAWRLARPTAPWAGPAAVVLAGLWLVAASPLLFLHSELWGLPLALGGALALRHSKWAWAAALLALAVAFRETYLVAFAAGALWAGRRRAWLVALIALCVFAAVHVHLAQAALAPGGREPPMGQAGGVSLHYALSAVSPSDEPFAWILGLAGLVSGVAGTVRRWSDDRAARLVLTTTAVLVPATIVFGRQYWGLTFGVAIACFAPAGVEQIVRWAPPHTRTGDDRPRLSG